MSASPPQLWIANLADDSYQTKFLDFQGKINGGVNPFSIVDGSLDLGTVVQEVEWLTGFEDGGAPARRRKPVREVSFALYVEATAAFAPMQGWIDLLNLGLDQRGVVVYNPNQLGTEQEYIDYHYGDLPSLLRGQERNLWKIFSLLKDPDGLPVRLFTQPTRRLSMRAAEDNLAVDAALVEDADFDGVPDSWEFVSLTGVTLLQFDWSYSARRMTVAAATTVTFRQKAAQGAPVTVGQSYCFSAYEAAQATGGSPPTFQAFIDWLDGAGAVISSTVGTLMSLVLSPAISFTRFLVVGIAPAGAVKARGRIVAVTSAGSVTTIWLRVPQFEVGNAPSPPRLGPQTVSMDVTAARGRRSWLWADGNSDAIVQARVTPGAGANVERLSLSRRSGFRNSEEFSRKAQGPLSTAARGLDTTVVSDPLAAGGSALQIAYTDSLAHMRARVEVTQTDLSALEGSAELNVTIRQEIGTSCLYWLRWGSGDVESLPGLGDPFPVDTGDALTSAWFRATLGTTVIPHASPGLFFEVWSQRISGTGKSFLGSWWESPADEMVLEYLVPGVLHPGQVAVQEWDWRTLLLAIDPTIGTFGAGIVSGGSDVLLKPASPDQATGIPPFGGMAFSAGVKHTLVANATVYRPNADGSKAGELRVYDYTAGASLIVATIKGNPKAPWTTKDFPVSFTPQLGRLYTAYVVMTAVDGNIHVNKISDTAVPAVQGNAGQVFAIDGDSRRAYVADDGNELGPLYPSRPGFLKARPTLQLVRVGLGDAMPAGYDSAGPGPLQQNVNAETAVVEYNVIPRKA